jgi:putative tricarboxylic transport membrane protein
VSGRGASRLSTDRVAGGALLILAVSVALEARNFRVAFLTDPVGPRALPLLVAAMLAACAIVLLRRPGPEPRWPGRPGLLRAAGGAAVFTLYGLLLEPLGFGVATTGAVAGLGVLFGGSPIRSLVAGVVVSTALWVLFVVALGIPLPLGAILGGGR